jgi:hypothetical protein
VVAGLVFAVWELSLIGLALWKVSRRHQFRRHYRVPVEIAGVIDRALARVVDLTPVEPASSPRVPSRWVRR